MRRTSRKNLEDHLAAFRITSRAGSERRVIEITVADNRFEYSIRRWGERKRKREMEGRGKDRERAVDVVSTGRAQLSGWSSGSSTAVHYVRCDAPRARIYKSYVRCIQEELARDAPRVAQPRKKRALLGNARRYVKKGGKESTCACVYVCRCVSVRIMRAVGRVNAGTRTYICAYTYISAGAGGRVPYIRREVTWEPLLSISSTVFRLG